MIYVRPTRTLLAARQALFWLAAVALLAFAVFFPLRLADGMIFGPELIVSLSFLVAAAVMWLLLYIATTSAPPVTISTAKATAKVGPPAAQPNNRPLPHLVDYEPNAATVPVIPKPRVVQPEWDVERPTIQFKPDELKAMANMSNADRSFFGTLDLAATQALGADPDGVHPLAVEACRRIASKLRRDQA